MITSKTTCTNDTHFSSILCLLLQDCPQTGQYRRYQSLPSVRDCHIVTFNIWTAFKWKIYQFHCHFTRAITIPLLKQFLIKIRSYNSWIRMVATTQLWMQQHKLNMWKTRYFLQIIMIEWEWGGRIGQGRYKLGSSIYATSETVS